MQIYLYLGFDGSAGSLSLLILQYLEKKGYRVKVTSENGTISICTDSFVIWIDVYSDKGDDMIFQWLYEDYNVRVNKTVDAQLYPSGTEKEYSEPYKASSGSNRRGLLSEQRIL